MVGADFTRTCEGCEHVVAEPWSKDTLSYYNSMLDVLDLAYMTVNHEKIPPNVLKEWVKLITDELSQISKIKRSDKARA